MKYDLIISLGENCACTIFLRKFYLQNYSYPFDWLTHANLETRINLLKNNFDEFLKKKNLQLKEIHADKNKHCDCYQDTKTNFYFYHDFPTETELEKSYPLIKEKYDRRINRLYQMINNSKTVLFVWLSKNEHHSLTEIEFFYNILKNKFKNQECFLQIMENSTITSIKKYNKNHIIIIKDNLFPDTANTILGNEKLNKKYFRKIKKNRNTKEQIYRLCYKILKLSVNLICIKSYRHKLRKLLDVKMLHTAKNFNPWTED